MVSQASRTDTSTGHPATLAILSPLRALCQARRRLLLALCGRHLEDGHVEGSSAQVEHLAEETSVQESA